MIEQKLQEPHFFWQLKIFRKVILEKVNFTVLCNTVWLNLTLCLSNNLAPVPDSTDDWAILILSQLDPIIEL